MVKTRPARMHSMWRPAGHTQRDTMSGLNSLPSVERLLQTEDVNDLVRKHGRPLTLDAIRLALEEMRSEIKQAPNSAPADIGSILTAHRIAFIPVGTTRHPDRDQRHRRDPAHQSGACTALRGGPPAMEDASRGYSNIEFDLQNGKRGSRLSHAEVQLQKLLNVEAAAVVNNNASAVLLVLSALAARRRVVISRSQLVEIGGGFRIPDVMKQSGARLVEVGTTNKVRVEDYEEALAQGDGILMHAHRSNFKIVGFTEEPSLAELAKVAHAAGRVLVDDLGSGALLDTARYGLVHEPTVQESLAAGADIVCFSGDKLMGGPQAGVIVGKADLMVKIRKHPLARAMRADKTCLAGLTATLLHYLRDEAEQEIPVWRMICMSTEEAKVRAQSWADALGRGSVVASEFDRRRRQPAGGVAQHVRAGAGGEEPRPAAQEAAAGGASDHRAHGAGPGSAGPQDGAARAGRGTVEGAARGAVALSYTRIREENRAE